MKDSTTAPSHRQRQHCCAWFTPNGCAMIYHRLRTDRSTGRLLLLASEDIKGGL